MNQLTDSHAVDPEYLQDVRRARVQLARVFEPADRAGMALLHCLGPISLLETITANSAPPPWLLLKFHKAMATWGLRSKPADLGTRFDAWRSRLPVVDPEIDARNIHSLKAWVVIPEDPDWPEQLADLGVSQPIAVWGRGERGKLAGLDRSVAVVGSRNASAYGAAVTREITHQVSGEGWCVISGGAYGIDAAAHSAALSAGTSELPTAAVLACGVDRFYPSANADLLSRIEDHGLLLSEVPLGCSPTRYRFLQRNRLIAALSRATVVTEAAWRSGSLNTAHHAESMSRDVAAVPGDVLAGGSAGCHKLIREDHAVLVNNGAEVLELLGPLGNDAAVGTHTQQDVSAHRPEDSLEPHLLRLYDALPLRQDAEPSHLCRVSGLSPTEVMSGLAALRSQGLAVDSLLGWRRVGSTHGTAKPRPPHGP